MHYILFLARYGCPLHPLQRAYEQTTVIGSAIEEKEKLWTHFAITVYGSGGMPLCGA